ncbi:23S rRNA (adenine(2030)-N(6))-methyltransferase RlmJ [Chromatium okenii]|uniref:23S rRNA (adenine(2030)-N(6))-methyltransferase RlmJ n=1 Tax=Chromatium okenii TaxID=61644 RepID=UPI0019070F8D|nr:23S rRNA (adenine(2030)-N(6))-methyltransferase RlmJ [Chromatium okenii]MBK1641425.1 23S rRNA (adenine(2030)-N(6))-methyltransferase RlmJ [Chromatium okenii]
MLSYLHGFHAGNHADVFKHSVLTLLLETLTLKPKPLTYLETHAGAGIYDLTSAQARKTSEATDGIKRLWARRAEFPELAAYFNAIAALNATDEIVRYPGSPQLAQAGLRDADQLILMELHPTEAQTLRHNFSHDARIHVHQRNGYEGLPALLPPTPSRGLVLIDPSYETAIEMRQVAETIFASYQRWAGGCYLIWYPRLGVQRDQAAQLLKRLLRQLPTLLTAELWVRPQPPTFGMYGSGVILINPPWQFELQLQALLPRLAAILAIAPLKDAGWHVEWRTATTA